MFECAGGPSVSREDGGASRQGWGGSLRCEYTVNKHCGDIMSQIHKDSLTIQLRPFFKWFGDSRQAA